ncbi:transcriptional regulator [Tsukamurella pulmonis]|uniref:helix-turn-helix transcriptional regulator n=1 Tax=Tsukamurella pulmonis TaxID=47312 RepID=UPI001EDFE893|nr:WYL domain-containing protein [Tsukamurella pulmonis]BDD81010.1 transcriptional regulator [Tsukamurella pulmonis]
MRADRLLSVLMLLRHRGTMTAAQLAAELEVSTRTVLRDVEALGTAGVPVYTDRGRGGGISLLPGYRTDLTGLTLDEAKALLAGAPDSPAFANAMRKVAAALPEAHRREATAAAQRIHVRPDGFARAPEPDPFLGELQRAVIDGLRVRAVYRPRGGTAAERVLDPVGLVHAGQAWYLMALRDGERRTYRTSRFSSVTVLSEPARRPAEVDLAAEFESSRASFRSGHQGVRVSVSADEYGWSKLAVFGTIVTPPGPDGAGVLAFSDVGRAIWTLWSALPHVRVHGPSDIRDVLRARLAEASVALDE